MRTGLWAVPVPKDAFCCCNLAAHLAPTCLRRKTRPLCLWRCRSARLWPGACSCPVSNRQVTALWPSLVVFLERPRYRFLAWSSCLTTGFETHLGGMSAGFGYNERGFRSKRRLLGDVFSGDR